MRIQASELHTSSMTNTIVEVKPLKSKEGAAGLVRGWLYTLIPAILDLYLYLMLRYGVILSYPTTPSNSSMTLLGLTNAPSGVNFR